MTTATPAAGTQECAGERKRPRALSGAPMLCPVCTAPVIQHNEETARIHLATWLRSISIDETVYVTGEYDGRRTTHVMDGGA